MEKEGKHNCCYRRGRWTQLLLWERKVDIVALMGEEEEHNCYYGRGRKHNYYYRSGKRTQLLL